MGLSPNLVSIAQQGTPAGSGLKWGKHKRKWKQPVLTETRSVRPSLETTSSPETISITTATTCSVYGPSSANVISSIPNQMNISTSLFLSSSIQSQSMMSSPPKAFILKIKTPQIRVCHSYWKGYEGVNDTLNLVVARMERWGISNLNTGVQFLGRERNSHYYLHLQCLRAVEPSFTGSALQIPYDIKAQLSNIQKTYLVSCILVPAHYL
jgi:hypothetical protein